MTLESSGPLRTFAPNIDLNGAKILVTGGTGSFGHAFIRAVLSRWKPAKLIVYSRDELKQYDMAQLFPPAKHECMRYFIGDVRDEGRLKLALRGVDYVIHAAALKHVPIAEYNPSECIHTNVMGAENIVRASLDAGVKRVVALSTDKAANPANLYGASKLASDKIFVASNNLAGDLPTRFSVVRYGNVIGSRGSVLPLFQKMLRDGRTSLPITDDRMTRFWITLDQGVNFVLSCMTMMNGGEIFVPKIPSMTVLDVAKAVMPELKYEVVGIRPGEKLHEVMITEDDSRNTLELDDRFIIGSPNDGWKPHSSILDQVRQCAEGFRYSSDNNTEWLSAEALAAMMRK